MTDLLESTRWEEALKRRREGELLTISFFRIPRLVATVSDGLLLLPVDFEHCDLALYADFALPPGARSKVSPRTLPKTTTFRRYRTRGEKRSYLAVFGTKYFFTRVEILSSRRFRFLCKANWVRSLARFPSLVGLWSLRKCQKCRPLCV